MRRIALFLAAALVALGVAAPALAATTTGIGTFGPLTGTSTDYETTMQLPATGFPQAAVTSSSRSGAVGPQSGASMWFGATTPPGVEFASSQNEPYLNLRPRADNATSPSITSYTFQRATPLGWGFVLGDIDADKVTISATKADGTAASAAELGFQSAFNMCDTSPKPSGCSGVVAPFDLPSWDAGTKTLTGNVGAVDTVGAAGWFKPTAALANLTFTFTQRSGFPVYQTWFAVKKQDITGTVTAAGGCSAAGVPVHLYDPTGALIGSTTTNGGGAYSFAGMSAGPGYHVELGQLVAGCITDDAISSPINLSSGDGTANFAIRAIIPIPISGHVRDENGNPLAGVTVSIDDGTNPIRTVTTDGSGYYIFDTNPVGDYTLTATPPAGYALESAPPSVPITITDTDPKTGNDFVLNAAPTVSGQVTGHDSGIAGVTVLLMDGPTEIDRTVTDADGLFEFTLVPPGTYTAAIPDPPGNFSVPDPEPVEVTTDDVSGVIFDLVHPGSISGTVTKDGTPAADAVVTITGPSSFSEQLTTDAQGNYAIGELTPGTYTATVTPPNGTTIDDPSQEIVMPPDGEDVGDVNFALQSVDSPDPDPGDTDSDPIPDTGGPSKSIGPLGLALIGLGSAIVFTTRPRGRHQA